eukprot:scaffold73989_cov59-Cyclotella_meneghiniana.AAC.2
MDLFHTPSPGMIQSMELESSELTANGIVETLVPRIAVITLRNHAKIPILTGGVGNARRNDRVFINLSPDGRVHEAPLIQ